MNEVATKSAPSLTLRTHPESDVVSSIDVQPTRSKMVDTHSCSGSKYAALIEKQPSAHAPVLSEHAPGGTVHSPQLDAARKARQQLYAPPSQRQTQLSNGDIIALLT